MDALTKSQLLNGLQCDLRLWKVRSGVALSSEPDPVVLARLRTGSEIGVLARGRYPGGVLVAGDAGAEEDALTATARLMAGAEISALYEASFEHAGVRVRVDILIALEGGGWGLVEVKSGTRCKDIHDLDLAIQAWVLRGAGVDLRWAGILTLDGGYVWPGGEYDLQAMFKLHGRTEAIAELIPELGPEVVRQLAMLSEPSAPGIEPGAHCTQPYRCPYIADCTRGLVEPQWSLSILPRLKRRKTEALHALGIDDIRQIPEDFDLSAQQHVVRQAVVTGAPVISGDLRAEIASLEAPVRYLDFEAMQAALPRFPGTRPYTQLPFQFSVHAENEGGGQAHSEYLHTDDSDPRRALAQALLGALGEGGSIVVYSSFERSVITRLGANLPDLRPALERLVPRLWDLLEVLKRCYYHPDFRGSFSIKNVLPAIVPELSYTDLSIADGATAAVEYERALRSGDRRERRLIFDSLRQYCHRDTIAMMKIVEFLRGVAACTR